MQQFTAAAIVMKKHCLHGVLLTAAALGRHNTAHQSKAQRNQDPEDGEDVTQQYIADKQKLWTL